jgi:hypothetical protein
MLKHPQNLGVSRHAAAVFWRTGPGLPVCLVGAGGIPTAFVLFSFGITGSTSQFSPLIKRYFGDGFLIPEIPHAPDI